MDRLAIFLSGTIGAGKTTLGRALAEALGAGHVEGDDHQQPPRPWYATALSTCRGTLAEALEVLETRPAVVVSYPLRCREWVYYRQRLGERGVGTLFVTLAADYEAIVGPGRERRFSAFERGRIREMIGEGYDRRPFSDAIVGTGDRSVAETLADLLAIIGLRQAQP